MKLKPHQELLVRTLKASKLDYDTAMLVCSGLQTERQQWMMLGWLNAVYDRTGEFPQQAAICKALSTIRQLTENVEADNREQDSPSP